ncbi:DUF3572 domain-containing protein [Ensifer soli]|uniref:DUF3572 domain-containing protein n=1 Tax=Ciceribacter sp. sgz301302 TaxID=3342379 RepID=UPI0035B9E084
MVEKDVTYRGKTKPAAKSARAGTDPSTIAAALLVWLASEPDLLGRFLALSGLDAQSLRAAATEDGFQAGLIDFVMGNEADLLAFCQASGIAPEDVVHAHAALSGAGESWP